MGGVEHESQVPSDPIKGALEEIGWSQEKIKVQGDSESSYSEQTNDWNNWEQNPYKNFYEQENDYKSALNGGIGRSDGKENLAQPSQELSEDSQSQIEFQVATKLLKLISPPQIESYSQELLDSLRKEESPVTKTTTEQVQDVAVTGDSEQIEENEEIGNCTIDSSMKDILQAQSQSEKDYYSVSCSNEETDHDHETTFGSRWGGAFPKTLFTLQDSTKLSKLNIKVKIDFDKDPQDDEYEFVIEFWGKQFNNTHDSKITGDFKYETELSDTNSTGAIIKLTNPDKKENIYLLIDLDG